MSHLVDVNEFRFCPVAETFSRIDELIQYIHTVIDKPSKLYWWHYRKNGSHCSCFDFTGTHGETFSITLIVSGQLRWDPILASDGSISSTVELEVIDELDQLFVLYQLIQHFSFDHCTPLGNELGLLFSTSPRNSNLDKSSIMSS